MSELKKALAGAFSDSAEGLLTGQMGRKRIGLTLTGSEHGPEELLQAARLAARNKDIEVVLIGSDLEQDEFEQHAAEGLHESHEVMEKLLDSGEILGCVTNHYSFPLGVATVGKVITPAEGREMIIATTTGTSDTARVPAMVKNAIAGMALAKATGIAKPTMGILNIDSASVVERVIKKLQDGGWDASFTESSRADGGAMMRGNDLLKGTPDVMVCDSLTGNLMMKIFSSYTTGGSYEALGFGYGPGLGEDADRLVGIISRASGAPMIAGALRLIADCAERDVLKLYKAEMDAAKKAGLDAALESVAPKAKPAASEEEVKEPAEKVCDADIGGVDILDIEDAKVALWKEGIYAKTGMGCTGPVVMMAAEDREKSVEILTKAEFIA